MITAVCGTNWGDEGKGRMVDLLSESYDIVVRYQGGNNAGHTVINDKGKFILNLLPSGILRDKTINVMGPGMVIDPEHLSNEIGALRKRGIKITPENLVISNRATICMPYHKLMDNLEEDRLGDKKYGSTRRGIAPVYADKYMKKVFRMGDLFEDENTLKDRLKDILEWKNLTVHWGYRQPELQTEEMMKWMWQYAFPLKEFIKDTTYYLSEKIESGKSVLFEAQLGALKDIDFGICPYTSSSYTLAQYAPLGAGVPFVKLDNVVAIMKAYSSAVGEGPFPCEFFGDDADKLREAGAEYGAATGRPRRVGGFDVVASKYGTMMQGATEIALTKLDVLSCYERIPVCTEYIINGKHTTKFPFGEELKKALPVYTYMQGWECDISKCRTFIQLPLAAKNYVHFIEDAMECKIKYISVGAERDAYIVR